jgi:hypothetical protein
MAKVKYDLSNVEDLTSDHAPVGVYRAKVASVDGPKPSSSGNQMLEVRFDLTHDATGKALANGNFMPVWYYPLLEHDHPLSQARFKEFLLAFGLKAKGTLDTDKLVGQAVQLRLKADTDQDGEYRPRIAKVMALPQQDEPEEAEEEAEEEEGEEEGELDLDGMNRTELKALIKEEGLDVRVLKSMSDDDLRKAIVEAWPEEEEEEEDEEEGDEEEEEEAEEEDTTEAATEEDEDDGYDDMTVAELKAELKERELTTAGARKILVQRLRKDDGAEAF